MNEQILTIAILFGIIIFSFLLIIFNPFKTEKILNISVNDDSSINSIVKIFGSDLIKFSQIDIEPIEEIERLLLQSGNKRNLTPITFKLLRIVHTFLGALIGLILSGFIAVLVESYFVIPLFTIFGTLIGFNFLKAEIKSTINKRENQILKELPNVLDLLTMAISGANFTLINGISAIIPYLEDGYILKDEFKKIIEDVNTGATVNQALLNFANRTSNSGVKSFVKAVNNASQLNVNMNDIMEGQSKETRRILEDEAQKRIDALPTKIVLALSLPIGLTVGALSLIPSLVQIMESMSGGVGF